MLVDGEVVKRPCTKRLAKVSEKYFTEESVRPLADLILAPINANTARPESSQTVTASRTRVPADDRDHQKAFHLLFVRGNVSTGQAAPRGIGVRATRTSDIDRIIKGVADSKPRAHTTLRNVKSFSSGGFRYAKRTDAIHDNPVRDSVIPHGKSRGETKAYTLEEIQLFLKVLGEPARTAVLVAAMTGLRVSEVMGLRWEDVVGDNCGLLGAYGAVRFATRKRYQVVHPFPCCPS